MSNVKITDNSIKVKEAMDAAITAWLYEAAGAIQGQTQQLTPVDTGQLKGSWDYNVDESAKEAKIGSPLENAIWNEFGTGQYALHGDGRKTPWHYKDRLGRWHTTTGKQPRRSLHFAYTSLKDALVQELERRLKK